MANITITHKVENLQAYSTNELHNIIKQVRFVIEASDRSQSKTSFFTVELDDPDAKTFVEFEQLTNNQVLQWVKAQIDPAQIAALENGLIGVLQEMAQTNKKTLQPVKLPD
jgi:Cu2+-containing amine oxidase